MIINKLVFLVEEPSMAEFLKNFLPRILPSSFLFQVISHNGKSDLEKSIPRKIRGWHEEGVNFVIIRDNDGGDCIAIKNKLLDICKTAGRSDALIRIACQELESWYLGDLESVGAAYMAPHLSRLQGKSKYRDPDHLGSPSNELKKLVAGYQKVSGGRLLGSILSTKGNKSKSFNVFLAGVARLSNS